MSCIHNNQIRQLIKNDYQLSNIQDIILILSQNNTFNFSALENGLFPAAIVEESTEYTGYASVWVRDNVFVAYSHYISGEIDIAIKNVQCLINYFKKHKIHFMNIIDGYVSPSIVMRRPHIRFNGKDLEEIHQLWEHAQNDALGYFLWFYCKLVSEHLLQPSHEDLEVIALFPLYFESISYWQDEDSGHWEEDRKVEASSIGVVVASLKILRRVYTEDFSLSQHFQYKDKQINIKFLDNLIQKGIDALNTILPSESIQKGRERRYDSALLFLIYPLKVLDEKMSDQIVTDVINNLQGKYGISRYKGDSFWCRDYEDIPQAIRTSISTEREQWFQENGRSLKDAEEAQWCIFDPIISAIFGTKFQETNKPEFLEKQVFYLNRSLGQITATDSKFGGFKCPELYYLQGDIYIPNDATPLLWTQANLRIALKVMEQSLSFNTIA
ncbi:glycoside hydrolase family 15 protein [Pseudanabaena sp. ABRG5-3]|uniref:glycoside hydrolase family 15 protein n=1 Tax=Pseudanabaena sp. ABRG5-3 TaxID=685565 RepID=UPI000DC6F63C|nr:glycoside hydrolase family 15 protein [Pseudanabaena sp. ABRG5-3]BBC24213.1 hypothetical protein ABRG53_1956 [Pseudanabaena sp. ABRG5-3]